jgi:hypothetical protein
MAKSIFYSKDKKTKREYLITLVEKTKNCYIKHNKTLCNINVYYLPLLSNIPQVEHDKNNMIYFQPFSIARIKV